jgi:hypothetical protein
MLAIVNSDEAALRIIVKQQRNEIERLRLTDAEREAIRFAAVLYEQGGRPADAATLRGLLQKTDRT